MTAELAEAAEADALLAGYFGAPPGVAAAGPPLPAEPRADGEAKGRVERIRRAFDSIGGGAAELSIEALLAWLRGIRSSVDPGRAAEVTEAELRALLRGLQQPSLCGGNVWRQFLARAGSEARATCGPAHSLAQLDVTDKSGQDLGEWTAQLRPVSYHEFAAVYTLFDLLDSNHDGRIRGADLTALLDQRVVAEGYWDDEGTLSAAEGAAALAALFGGRPTLSFAEFVCEVASSLPAELKGELAKDTSAEKLALTLAAAGAGHWLANSRSRPFPQQTATPSVGDRKLSAGQDFGCGIFMGVVQCMVGHPFDTLKVRVYFCSRCTCTAFRSACYIRVRRGNYF
jgi:hypothetical protein